MSIRAPDSAHRSRSKEALISFLILFPFSIALLGVALALGVEPRMRFERTGERVFRVTGSNHLVGVQFYARTIEGVTGVRLASASRNDRRDSIEERNRRASRTRLDFDAANGAVLSWGRTEDSRQIDEFMRSTAPTLALVDAPPSWRRALSWFSLGLGVLTLAGTVRNSFFPKK